jgi:hypothetical protein
MTLGDDGNTLVFCMFMSTVLSVHRRDLVRWMAFERFRKGDGERFAVRETLGTLDAGKRC